MFIHVQIEVKTRFHLGQAQLEYFIKHPQRDKKHALCSGINKKL